MAITLIDTPGGPSANTYCSLADATSILSERLYTSVWTAASANDQSVALVWATRMLDRYMEWYGYPASSTQALNWPLANAYDFLGNPIASTIIPQPIKTATAELAMALLAKDRSKEASTKGFKNINVQGISINVNVFDRPGIIPQYVYDILIPFGRPVKRSSIDIDRS